MDKLNVLSDVTGSIWKIFVKIGDIVQEGDQLAICESMKMEIPLEAEIDDLTRLHYIIVSRKV